VLREWLGSDGGLVYELRDEGMLKLFFSDVAPETRIGNTRCAPSISASSTS
jgi:hypothetical protein